MNNDTRFLLLFFLFWHQRNILQSNPSCSCLVCQGGVGELPIKRTFLSWSSYESFNVMKEYSWFFDEKKLRFSYQDDWCLWAGTSSLLLSTSKLEKYSLKYFFDRAFFREIKPWLSISCVLTMIIILAWNLFLNDLTCFFIYPILC